MNAGTFYKALSYACLYRDETEDADEILNTDTTVTLVREQKTEKLLRQLGEKYELTKHAEGIYRINGMMFPGDLYLNILFPRKKSPISFLITAFCFFLITRKSIRSGILLRLCSRSYFRSFLFSHNSNSTAEQNAGCHCMFS